MVRGVAKSWRAGAGTAWAALVLVLALLAATPQARADLTTVARDLAGLRAELAELRGIQLVQATPGERAQFEVRLGQLEEELRRLTGRIEQLEFGQRSVESRIDQLIQDLDVRLGALEQGTAAPGQGEPGPGADAGPGSGSTDQADVGAGADQGSAAGFGRAKARSASCRRARCSTCRVPTRPRRRRRRPPACRRSASTIPRWSCCAPATIPAPSVASSCSWT